MTQFKTEVIMLKNQVRCAINPFGIAMFISLVGVAGKVESTMAQIYPVTMEEDVTLTGESLRGLDSSSLAGNQFNTPQWDVTIEREKPKPSVSTGNEFFDSLLQKQSEGKNPTPEQKLNTNQGDVPIDKGSTIPLFNF